jgi:hypothetical protein
VVKGGEIEGMIGIERCKNNMRQLEGSIREDKMESLKSLA